jgi:hypothetical protein
MRVRVSPIHLLKNTTYLRKGFKVEFYVCRELDTVEEEHIFVYPAYMGIQRHLGCVEYGTEKITKEETNRGYQPMYLDVSNINTTPMILTPIMCADLFGFIPRKGEAFFVKQVGEEIIAETVFGIKEKIASMEETYYL